MVDVTYSVFLVVIGVWAVLCLLVIAVIYFLDRPKPRWLMDRGEKLLFDFKEIFGISPYMPGSYRSREEWEVVVQGIVDHVLKLKADFLHAAFENESRWSLAVADKSSLTNDEVKCSKNAKQSAEKSKRYFWQAHNTASHFVKTRKSYKDYLSVPEEAGSKKNRTGT